ncbi:hypothetical protein [Leptolyngbya sp. ST-U4]|uniref:hypothetical protein n=1 Tax=Leptolyngbya sp. ST-U4 TaxID=2933912 RepID=UPI0032984E00
MGIFDAFKEVAKAVQPIHEIIPDELQNIVEVPEDIEDLLDSESVGDVITEFDPTNPDAVFRDEIRVFGDVGANIVTGGAAGTAFSDGAEGIETLNDFSDNAFTAGNIGDAASDFADDFGF